MKWKAYRVAVLWRTNPSPAKPRRKARPLPSFWIRILLVGCLVHLPTGHNHSVEDTRLCQSVWLSSELSHLAAGSAAGSSPWSPKSVGSASPWGKSGETVILRIQIVFWSMVNVHHLKPIKEIQTGPMVHWNNNEQAPTVSLSGDPVMSPTVSRAASLKGVMWSLDPPWGFGYCRYGNT